MDDISVVPEGRVIFGVGKLLFPDNGSSIEVEVVTLENKGCGSMEILSERVVQGGYNEVLRALQELGMVILGGQCQLLLSSLRSCSLEKSP